MSLFMTVLFFVSLLTSTSFGTFFVLLDGFLASVSSDNLAVRLELVLLLAFCVVAVSLEEDLLAMLVSPRLCRRAAGFLATSAADLAPLLGKISADRDEYAARRSFSSALFDVVVDRFDLLEDDVATDELSKSKRDVCLLLLLRVRLPTEACLFIMRSMSN